MALSRGSKWFMAFGLLIVAAGAAGVWWLDNNFFGEDIEAGQAVEYEVSRGQSVRSVGDELAELGVVRSSFRFGVAAEDAGLSEVLQPGLFELETGMSNDAVIEVLAAGPLTPPQLRFTVSEGLTVEQTIARLADQFDDYAVSDFREVLDDRIEAGGNLPGVLELPAWVPEPGEVEDDQIEPFEGLLFPETYDVPDDATAQDILQRMINQLVSTVNGLPEELLAAVDTSAVNESAPDGDEEGEADDGDEGDDEGEDEAEESSGRPLYEHLVLASLIERETRVDDERGMVAGVIENRLEEGMQLQIDATVVYAMGAGPTAIVLLEDLEIDHPHNTYQIEGLPPTPISGFGAASLRASLDPDDVPYRYYVLDASCDGSHVFAETGEEHNANVAEFRDAGRCQEELDP